ELARGGSLWDAIERADGPLDETYVRSIAAELILALLFLKKQRIVHRDIKPENILLTARGRPLLADFGMAVQLDNGKGTTGSCGTPGYTAPEVIRKQEYGFPADVFSLGCMVFECLTGYGPFESQNAHASDMKTMHEKLIFPDEQELDFYTKHFIGSLLEKDPHKRAKAEDAKQSAYLE
ncbi:kinase-like domain-containing protein, partial [Phellopilus nigrolimitatus]